MAKPLPLALSLRIDSPKDRGSDAVEGHDGFDWSVSEFRRMLALNSKVFFEAAFTVGRQAFAGSERAAVSTLHALTAASATAWLSKSDSFNGTGGNLLVENAGFAMRHWYADAVDVTLRQIESHFRAEDGAWKDVKVTTTYGERSGGVFGEYGAASNLAVHAMHHGPDQESVLHLLRRLGPWSGEPWTKPMMAMPEARVEKVEGAPNQGGFKGNLIAHAILGDNVAALRALKSWDPEGYKTALQVPVCLVSPDHYSNFQKHALELAASAIRPSALRQLIEDAHELLEPAQVRKLLAEAMFEHVKQTGMHGQEKNRQLHEAQLPVWQVLSDGGGGLLLEKFPDWAIAYAQSQDRGRKNVPDADLFELSRQVAREAISHAHPEAVKACSAVYEHPVCQSLGMVGHSRGSRAEDSLAKPFRNLIGAVTHAAGMTSDQMDRVLMSMSPDVRERDLRLCGGDALRSAAKQGNLLISTMLVQMGVDAGAKDDRGWTAASHFKDEDKVSWNAFLQAQKAKNRLADIVAMARQNATASRPAGSASP